jgi:branched-subunit amino acid aminotransferase/4-amino-4-deoxychorismate lyase
MSFVCLNGDFLPAEEARISVFDRGFAFGDALFETLKVLRGRPVFFSEHLARLAAGLAEAGIGPAPDEGSLREQAIELARRNCVDLGRLRIQVTRGTSADSSGPDPVPGLSANVLVTLSPFDPLPARVYEEGITCRTAPLNRGRYAHLKSSNLLATILARQEVRGEGASEVIFCRADGGMLEGGYSNLFFLREDTLMTAPETEAILAGVTRAKVLELAAGIGLRTELRAVSVEELERMHQVSAFITSSVVGLVPIRQIDESELTPPGELQSSLRNQLTEMEKKDTLG